MKVSARTVVRRVEAGKARESRESWTNICWLAFESGSASGSDGCSFLLEVNECWGISFIVKMAGLNPMVESRGAGAAEVVESGLIPQVVAMATVAGSGISGGVSLKAASRATWRWTRGKPQGSKEGCEKKSEPKKRSKGQLSRGEKITDGDGAEPGTGEEQANNKVDETEEAGEEQMREE